MEEAGELEIPVFAVASTPRELFTIKGSPAPEPNIVRFRLGRHDGVDLSLQAKSPGAALITNTVELTVEFAAALGERKESYERLLDARAKPTPFTNLCCFETVTS